MCSDSGDQPDVLKPPEEKDGFQTSNAKRKEIMTVHRLDWVMNERTRQNKEEKVEGLKVNVRSRRTTEREGAKGRETTS